MMIKQLILPIFMAFFMSACSFYQGSQVNYTSNMFENRLQSIAYEWKKTPYRLGGISKKGADCSGFTQSIFKEFGTTLPRNTITQIRAGEKVAKENLTTGDLLFFRTGRGPNNMHVGIYLSQNEFIHLSTKGGVRKVSLEKSYWKKRYITARRVAIQNYYTQR